MEELSKADLFKLQRAVKEEVMKRQELDPDDYDVNVYVKRKQEIDGKSYMILFQDTEFLLTTVLSSTECKMVMLIRALCKYENKVPYSGPKLSKVLGVSRTAGYKAIKSLKEYGILVEFKDENDERRHNLYLNPEVAWKGKLQNKAKVQSVFAENGKFKDFKEKPKSLQQMNLFEDEFNQESPKQKKAKAKHKEDEWTKGKGAITEKKNPNDNTVEYYDLNGILIRVDSKDIYKQIRLHDKEIDVFNKSTGELIGTLKKG